MGAQSRVGLGLMSAGPERSPSLSCPGCFPSLLHGKVPLLFQALTHLQGVGRPDPGSVWHLQYLLSPGGIGSHGLFPNPPVPNAEPSTEEELVNAC